MAEPALGSTIADCELEEIVGRGGMGVVYKARQLSLDRVVALKAIAPELSGDEDFRERFKRESRIAASIEHPNVIPVHQAGEADGLLYLTMRYVEGIDLRALIDEEGALQPARAARIVAQVAAALAAAHARDLVHRDVKPGNVLIDRPEEFEHIYLTDFGIARHLAATKALTKTGAVVGTMDYLAPEQVEGLRADARSDVYALGCVLFETLTGRVPFPRDNEAAKMFAHMSAPVPSAAELRPEVPGALDEIARRAMEKDPGARFQSATELAQELLPHAGTGPAPLLPPPAQPKAVEPIVETPPEATVAGAPPTELAAPPTEAAPPPTEAAPPPTRHAAQPARPAPPPSRPAPPPSRPAPPPSRAAPPEPPRRRRVGGLLVAAVAAVGVVAAVAALALSGGGGDEGSEPAGGEKRSESASGEELSPRALSPVRLGRGNSGVAVGEGSVWVADRFEDVVRRVNPGSRRVGSTIRMGDFPRGVAIGAGGVWVAIQEDDTVSRIDPETEEVTNASVGDQPVGVAVVANAVWTANSGDGTATRIDLATGRARTGRVGRKPIAVAVVGDTAWVTAQDEGTVVPLDASTAASDGRPIRLGGEPRGITFADGVIWVTLSTAGAVVAIDPSTRRVIERIQVGPNPRQVGAIAGAVWVTVAGANRVVAIDPSSREVVARVRVGGEPHGLGVGAGRVWAASESGALTPIDPRGG